MFTLTLKTENAAFQDGAATEVSRILQVVASRLDRGDTEGNLMDVNGNKVGSFALTDD